MLPANFQFPAVHQHDDDLLGCAPEVLPGLLAGQNAASAALNNNPVNAAKPNGGLSTPSVSASAFLPNSAIFQPAVKPKIETVFRDSSSQALPQFPLASLRQQVSGLSQLSSGQTAIKATTEGLYDTKSSAISAQKQPAAPKFTASFEPPVLENVHDLRPTSLFFSRYPGCKEHDVCQGLVEFLISDIQKDAIFSKAKFGGVDFVKAQTGMVLQVTLFDTENTPFVSFELGVYSLTHGECGLTDGFALEFVPLSSGNGHKGLGAFSELFLAVKEAMSSRFQANYCDKLPESAAEKADSVTTASSEMGDHEDNTDDEFVLPALPDLDLTGNSFLGPDIPAQQATASETQLEQEELVAFMRHRLASGGCSDLNSMIEVAETLKEEVSIVALRDSEQGLFHVAEIVEFLLEETTHASVVYPTLCFLHKNKSLAPEHLLEAVQDIVKDRQVYGGYVRAKAREVIA